MIEASRPGGGYRRLGLFVPLAWVLVLAAAVTQRSGAEQAVISLVAIGMTLGVSLLLRAGMAAGGREQQTLAQMEDRLALKHTPAVAAAATQLLARPMRSPENRLRAILLLATALARLDQQEDAIALYDQLLDHERVGGPGAAIIRVARAMALLRADRLFDADRAISDLRQRLKRPAAFQRPIAAVAVDYSEDAADQPAGLIDAGERPELPGDDRQLFAATRLVELYRDIKTGHAEDALTLFETDRDALRDALGHRYAEVLGLTAAAHHALGHYEKAAEAFAAATTLLPAVELVRKYPELNALSDHYSPTPPPPRR